MESSEKLGDAGSRVKPLRLFSPKSFSAVTFGRDGKNRHNKAGKLLVDHRLKVRYNQNVNTSTSQRQPTDCPDPGDDGHHNDKPCQQERG
ncbi:MAG: hypothetical protein IPL51_02780 [Candidatus Competibacteraceae bacterium]|nr:hypothetical protein [Candidatus Competibacteraceae bacterium]